MNPMEAKNAKSFNRSKSGAKAQRFGALFEKMFKAHCDRMLVVATRMPDGCKQLGFRKLIRVKTPWDWIITHGGKSAYIDTKTSDADSFGHSKIEEHQVSEMLRHEHAGATAGYVVWLRKCDQIIFMPANSLAGMIGKRGSFDVLHKDALHIGSSTFMDIRKIFRGYLKGLTEL